MNPRSILFTRQQISELSGVDETVLAYWIKESLLRADEGGGGKGQHRRFRWHQVNLAAILQEVRTISGASVASLRELAALFHGSIDWFKDRGMAGGDVYLVGAVKHDYAIAQRHGHLKRRKPGVELLQATEDDYIVETWEEHFAYMKGADDYSGLEDRHFALALELPKDEFEHHREIYHTVVPVPTEPSSNIYGSMFFREDGCWKVQSMLRLSAMAAPPISFIGVDVPNLLYRVWSQS